MIKSQLPQLINWTSVLGASRYSGGHRSIMEAIFDGSAKVAAYEYDDREAM